MKDRDRWVNWDALAVGEDFWDMMEEMDESRKRVNREQKQMKEIRRVHDRKLRKHHIDPEGLKDEPYGYLCNSLPVESE